MKKIKTKKVKVVNGQTLIVSVDMSKDRHFGYWRCPDGTDVKPFAFWNNGKGFQEFWERISQAKVLYNLETLSWDMSLLGRTQSLWCISCVQEGCTWYR